MVLWYEEEDRKWLGRSPWAANLDIRDQLPCRLNHARLLGGSTSDVIVVYGKTHEKYRLSERANDSVALNRRCG